MSERDDAQAMQAALDEMARVAGSRRRGDAAKPSADRAHLGEGDPLVDTFRILLDALNVHVALAPVTQDEAGCQTLAQQAGVFLHAVALSDGWWRGLARPLLAFAADDGRPLAILPRAGNALVIDVSRKQRHTLNASRAAVLIKRAYGISQRLPDHSTRHSTRHSAQLMALLRLALPGSRAERSSMLTCAGLAGIAWSALPLLLGLFVQTMLPSASAAQRLQFIAWLGLAALMAIVLQRRADHQARRFEARTAQVFQIALMDRLLHLPAEFFRRHSAADWSRRIFRVNHAVQGAALVAHQQITAMTCVVFALSVMAIIDAKLAGFAAGFCVTLIVVSVTARRSSGFFLRRPALAEPAHHPLSATAEARTRLTHDLLRGASQIQAAGAGKRAFNLWAWQTARYQHLQADQWTHQRRVSLLEHATSVAVFLMLAAMAVVLQSFSMQPLAARIVFFACAAQALFALNALFVLFDDLARRWQIFSALHDLLAATPERTGSALNGLSVQGELRLDRLHFRYAASAPPVLQDCSLVIRAGETLAIAGPSGSGKSTLLRLLLGLETPQSGAVYLDGRDIAGLDLRDLRAAIGAVLQGEYLQAGDIFSNVVGAAVNAADKTRGRQLDRQAVWRALALVGLSAELRALPLGLDTPISDGAPTLAAGQRQRLLLARALVKEPRILLLDEATSALDNASQATVAASLARLRVTRVIVTHRLSTLRQADRIAWLDGGRVCEVGSWDELIAANGAFAAYVRQL